jgi:diacylglycerol kinase family enzyme
LFEGKKKCARRAALAKVMELRERRLVTARRLAVVVNPVSGSGKAKRTLEKTVQPMLCLAGVHAEVMLTERRGHACEIARGLDPAMYDGVLVLGGDGLVYEVVTGIMENSWPDARQRLPLGILPTGTANAMAHDLDQYASSSRTELISRVVLAAIQHAEIRVDAIGCHFCDAAGVFASASHSRHLPSQIQTTRSISGSGSGTSGSGTNIHSNSNDSDDVVAESSASAGKPHSSDSTDNNNSSDSSRSKSGINVSDGGAAQSQYALSVFGWGMGGAVVKVADQLRWIPGQRSVRYDLASFVSVVKDWPPNCPATISYPKPRQARQAQDTEKQEEEKEEEEEEEEEGIEWVSEQVNFANLIATKLPWLGKDHRISREVEHSDGKVSLTWMEASASRSDIVRAGMAMKKGGYLSEQPKSRLLSLSEFYLFPSEASASIDMLVDGDPMPARAVHVVVDKEAIALFSLTQSIV